MQPSSPAPHIPVLLEEVLAALNPQAGDVVVDGTFGAGGYSEAVLERTPARIIAIDRDPDVLRHAERLRERYGERFRFHQGCFSEMARLIEDAAPVQGIMLDIGVSSMQLDTAERGFSFRFDAPLDMRMSQSGVSAADIVNQRSAAELADIFWTYGEEKASRRIAAAIVREREEAPIATTTQLREIIHRILPPRGQAIDPATRSFQALRIVVNQELDELELALHAAESLLAEHGRLAVVTFHSLEDRIVKQFFTDAARQEKPTSRHLPQLAAHQLQPTFRLEQRKAVTATAAEIARNPRARSAKLRAGIRTSAPARVVKGGAHA